MALIDLSDDTFVAADPAAVATVVADPRQWTRWWPDLRLVTTRDRGPKGRQWRVDGPLLGTAEIWLEPWGDGVVVHHYQRLDLPPTRRPTSALQREAARERARRTQAWKRAVHALKDDLERGRRPGTPVEPVGVGHELPASTASTAGLKVPGGHADAGRDER